MPHPYTEENAFRRLILLIKVLLQHPGIGASTQKQDVHHNALQEVQKNLLELAKSEHQEISASIPTLRKDLGLLRRWGILDDRMYRWGYFLGTGVMTNPELQVALNALASQAKYQRDPQIIRIYESIARRLYGSSKQSQEFYPVRTQIDRVIVQTDPEEMMLRGQYRNTLFHQLPQIETAILQGQAIELYHCHHLYVAAKPRYVQVYPLQLIYSDIAWYLLHEEIQTGHLAIVRCDRLSAYFQALSHKPRGLSHQHISLKKAHRLIETGWGVYLGNQTEQQQELQGQSKLIQVTVRFFPPVVEFILEGECRHPTQKVKPSQPRQATGQIEFVDYSIKLPPRSLQAFGQWVNRFMDAAIILEPQEMATKHYLAAQALSNRYKSQTCPE